MASWKFLPVKEIEAHDHFKAEELVDFPFEHQAWVLDICSINWARAISEEKHILPIPFVKKWGFSRVYRPAFIQKFFAPIHFEKSSLYFFESLIKHFPCGQFQLDKKFDCPRNVTVVERPNYILPLDTSYDLLSQSFAENTRRNIQKADQNKLQLRINSLTVNEASDFILANHKKLDDTAYLEEGKLRNLITEGLTRKAIKLYSCHTESDELVSICVLALSQHRLIYSVACSSEKGYQLRGMYFIVSEIIKAFQQSAYEIDFEGSAIPGVANFFKGFGAKLRPYYSYNWNLHWLCKVKESLKR